MSSEPLQQAYQLIRQGSKQEAIQILLPIVRAEPLNADAWWLLANAIENPERKRRALEQVLKLRPGDEAARRMLDRLQPPPADRFDAPLDEAPRVRVHRSNRRSPLTIILALIGLLTVVSCAACLLIIAVSFPSIQIAVQKVVLTLTFEPGFATLASFATPAAPATMPTNLQMRGSVAVGQKVSSSVDTFRDDGWTFSADAGEHVIIEVDATDPSLDPHLYLYNSRRLLIADNDDIDGANNRNSRIDITLPGAGSYTIRVGKVGGGRYTLSLQGG